MQEGDERGAGGEPRPPGGVRYSRRWFLVLAGTLLAGSLGVVAAFRRLAGNGSGTGGVASGLADMFGSFPVRSVEKVPDATLSQWTVTVDGLVDKPLKLDGSQWQSLKRLSETVDFSCVEGWSVDKVTWAGVAPAELLAMAHARADGKFVNFHAYTGEYVDSLPLDLVMHPKTVLADTLNDEPLPSKHGGPLRLIVPVQLGYKSVKWVTRLEVADHPARGYWEQRGYPMNAPVGG
jgi:DMSO/TMAO reductase YedYZ molybdopterin-dependent catalytic subunit